LRSSDMNKEAYKYTIQADPDQYDLGYNRQSHLANRVNLINLCHQLNDIGIIVKDHIKKTPRILIIGVGDGLLGLILTQKYQYHVDTVDIDKRLSPTFIGSVDNLSGILTKKYDIIVCCHVLEHLPFKYFSKSLEEIRKFSSYSIIYLPIANLRLFLHFGLNPLFSKTISFVLTLFFKKPKFDGQHYWEIGLKNFSLRFVRRIVAENLGIMDSYHSKEWPYSYNFLLRSNRK